MQWGASHATAQLDWGKLASSAARPRHALRPSQRRAAIVVALMTCDLLAVALAVAASEIIVPSSSWNWSEGALFAALAPLHGWLGLYGCWGACPIERLRRRGLTALGLGAATFAMTSAWNAPMDAVALGLIILLLFVLGHYLEGLARLVLMRNGLWGAPTVLIGSPQTCSQIASRLLSQPKLGLLPVGIVTDRPDSDEQAGMPVPILCDLAEVHRLAGFAEVAIVDTSDLTKSEGVEAIRLFRLPFAHVIVAESTGGIPNLGLRTRNLGDAVGLEVRFDLFRPGNLAIKRMIDLAIAIPVMIAVAPVIVLLAMAIKIADPGPAFYRQRRIGRNGQALNVLKLRTMYGNAEERLREHLQTCPEARAEWSRFFKLSADPRILPGIGPLLRRFSLDELPQFWNILCGDMSLVGPRPFPDYHMNSFDPAFQAWRVSVPPGLTGLWQVSSRSGGDIEVQKEQDLFYIRNWSIWLDIYIIIETFPAVFTARGAK